MASQFVELVISSPYILIKGFLMGLIIGTGKQPQYYFSRRSGIKTETLGEHLKEWLGMENYIHLCIEDAFVPEIKEAIEKSHDKLGMEIISCKGIRSAYFDFSANLHETSAVDAFEKDLKALPADTATYSVRETDLINQGWDIGPGGFSAVPFHRYIIEGKITGDFDYVLGIFMTLKENPLVDLSEVILVLTDKHETPFSC